MIEAVLSIKIPGLWACDISEKYPVRLRFTGCMPGEERGMGLVELSGERDVLEKALEEIENHPSVGSLVVESRDEGRARIVVSVTGCDACRYLMTSGCFLMAPFSGVNGYMDWVLVTDRRDSLNYLFEKLKEAGCQVRVKQIKDPSEGGVLTLRQEEVVRTAMEKGYFEFPRKVSLKALADELGVSVSTLAEIMRAAQQKVMKEYLGSP